MPAKSKAQQAIFGMARAIQEGKMPPEQSPTAAKVAKTTRPRAIQEFASTPTAGLPQKVSPTPDTMPPIVKPQKVRRYGANKQQRKPKAVRKANQVSGLRQMG